MYNRVTITAGVSSHHQQLVGVKYEINSNRSSNFVCFSIDI